MAATWRMPTSLTGRRSSRATPCFEDRKGWVNGLGESSLIAADPETGVIDMYAGPTEEELAVFPILVGRLPGGKAAHSFHDTGLDMPDELFESQYEALLREFDNIRDRFA